MADLIKVVELLKLAAQRFDQLRLITELLATSLNELSDEESSLSSQSSVSEASSQSSNSSLSSKSDVSSQSSRSSASSQSSSRSSASSVSSLSSSSESVGPTPTKQSIWGWNVGPASFWGRSRPFRNYACLNNIHYGRADQGPATFNRLGELVSGKANGRLSMSSLRCPPGEYELVHSGGAVVTRFTVPPTGQWVTIDFNLQGPCPNLTCRRVGDTSTKVCTDAFIARHTGTAGVRLMDLLFTNTDDDRGMNHYRVNREGSSPIIEECITPRLAHAMATECGNIRVWWNWHHRATNQFVVEVCEEFLALGGTYPIWFELTNEAWLGVQKAGYMDAQFGGRYAFLNRRTKEIMTIAKGILGSRAVGVIGSQSSNYGVTQQVLAGGTDGLIDYLAIAPYYSYFSSWSGTDDALLTFVRNYERTQCRPDILWQRDYAAAHGLKLTAYESGSDLSEYAFPQHAAQFQRVNKSEAMADIYRNAMAFWKENVGEPYFFFNTLNPKSYGHWDEELVASEPRGRVVQEAIATAVA